MLSQLKKIYFNSRFYSFFRYNSISNLLIELKTKKTDRNINFYKQFLDIEGSNKLVFDVGANKGNKTAAFLKMGCKVIALEPERKSIETLRYRFGNNPNVIIVEKGVSDYIGELPIFITESRSGLNTLSNKWVNCMKNEEDNRWHAARQFSKSYTIQTTTLDQLIKEYSMPYFIKIDVEGFELNVVKGLSVAPPVLSFECNLPEFKSESIEIIRLISSIAKNPRFQFSVDDRLESKKWLDTSEIISIIESSQYRYLEIICNSR